MTHFAGEKYDNRYTSLVGWDMTADSAGAGYKFFFSQETVDFIGSEITRVLKGFGMDIRVAPHVIGSAMSDVIRAQNPVLGDIHTRYTMPKDPPRNDARSMINEVINVIVNQILTEQQVACSNAKLSVWSSVLGNFNAHGLRQYSLIDAPIKRNDIIKGVFMMNY
jgi:hypothetical protein